MVDDDGIKSAKFEQLCTQTKRRRAMVENKAKNPGELRG